MRTSPRSRPGAERSEGWSRKADTAWVRRGLPLFGYRRLYGGCVTDVSVNPQQTRGGHDRPLVADWVDPTYRGVVVTIGDALVTPDSVLVPQGRFPLAGTTWTVQDATRTVLVRPTWAKRAAAILGFTLVGLLFLLVKQRREDGFVSATVVGAGLYHSVKFPPGAQSRAHVAALVNQARALAAMAPEVKAA